MKKILFQIAALAMIGACSQAPKTDSNSENANSQQSSSTATDEHAGHDHAMDMGHKNPDGRDTTPIKVGQRVYFKNVKDGQTIKLPFVVEFGVEGMAVAPANGFVPGQGHHHLLIDKPAINAGDFVPMAMEPLGFYHYGKGQTSDTLNINKFPLLKPGEHTLRLQFADGTHSSYGPAMSTSVKVKIAK